MNIIILKNQEELLTQMVISVAKKEGFNLSKGELIALLGKVHFVILGVLQKIVGSVEEVK